MIVSGVITNLTQKKERGKYLPKELTLKEIDENTGETTGKLYNIKIPAARFLPIWEGDFVKTELTNYDERYQTFGDYPFVVIPDDDSQLITCIKKCGYHLRINGKEDQILHGFNKAFKQFNHYPTIATYLDKIAEMQYEYDNFPEQVNEVTYPDTALTRKSNPVFFRRWLKERIYRQLYLLGFAKKDITHMAKKYKLTEIYSEAIRNPYKITSIPIEVCDSISMMMHGEINPEHQRGGNIIRYLEHKMDNNSWTYVPEYIMIKEFQLSPASKTFLSDEFGLVFDDDRVYSHYGYEVETKVASFLNDEMLRDKPEVDESYFQDIDHLSPKQKEAAIFALSHNFSVIIGKPGTGKSTVSAIVARYLEEHEECVFVTSFTGNATDRSRECILAEMKHLPEHSKKLILDRITTLDKLISKYSNANRELPAVRKLIIDELGMTTTELFYRLISCKPLSKHLDQISGFGDDNQLPPITWGHLLSSLLKGGAPVYRLEECFRCVGTSSYDSDGREIKVIHPILRNADILLENALKYKNQKTGTAPAFESCLEFKRIKGDIFTVRDTINNFHRQGVLLTDFRVLSPVRAPLDMLNDMINDIYFPEAEKVMDKWGKTWVVGSLVMVTKNFYGHDYQLVNGEEGTIIEVGDDIVDESAYQFVLVEFKNKENPIKFYTIEDEKLSSHSTQLLAPSSAKTVHKSQGKEHDIIIYYFPQANFADSPYSFYNYKINYTAITRAKKIVRIIGHLPSFSTACVRYPHNVKQHLEKRLDTYSSVTIEESDEEEPCFGEDSDPFAEVDYDDY